MPIATAMLLLTAAMTMTGANVPLAKALLAHLPAEALLLMRFALASACLAVLVRFEPGPPLTSLDARQWGAVIVLGVVGSVMFTWFVLEGVRRTSGASAGIITATLPAVVALAGIVLGHRPSRGQMAMIAMAVAGVALLQGEAVEDEQPGNAQTALIGNALIGLAVACEATFVIVARGISARVRPLRLSLGVSLASLVVCLPFGLGPMLALAPGEIGGAIWIAFAWYALSASVLCTALWYRGAAHVEPWLAGLATAAVPVAAIAVSALVLGEPISSRQIAGGVLVIMAIAIGSTWQRT